MGLDDFLRTRRIGHARRNTPADVRPGIDVAAQSGRTIDLFDWTGVTPTGTFTISSPYTWNLANLYTTGEVTLTAVPSLPGDFNSDGTVDAADYVVWRKTDGTTRAATTPGAPTSAKPPAAARVPARMPPSPNRQL